MKNEFVNGGGYRDVVYKIAANPIVASMGRGKAVMRNRWLNSHDGNNSGSVPRSEHLTLVTLNH